MIPRWRQAIGRSSGWARSQPAVLLFLGSDEQFAAQDPKRFRRTWVGVLVASAAWGVASAVLWEAASAVFGWYSGIPLIPAAAVLSAGCMGLYRRGVAGLVELLSGRDGTLRAMTAAVIVLVWSAILLGLRGWTDDWAPYPWWLIRPRAMYRPLLLAPVWGAWAMLVTCKLRRPTAKTEPAITAFAAGYGPVVTTAVFGVLLAVTISYFNYMPWTQLTICATGAASAVLSGWLFSRSTGGPTRRALLAANVATQLGFLLGYLANK